MFRSPPDLNETILTIMKQILLSSLFFSLLLFGAIASFGQVLDPNDPVVEYNPDSPPVRPAAGEVKKWVRTQLLNWNTDSYKCYIYGDLQFRLKFPKNYDPNAIDTKKYPLVVIFHGKGEAGGIYQNEKQLVHSGWLHQNAIDKGVFDGFALFAQTSGGWPLESQQQVSELIDYMVVNAQVDPFRVNVHGLSNGGKAAWSFLINFPEKVASVLPMSATTGDRHDTVIHKIKYIPIWNSQGGLDANPTPSANESLRDLILSYGGNFRYSLYPDLGHGVWNTHYKESDFFPFLTRANKVNPWPLFGRTEFCPGDNIDITLGVYDSFDGYEWRKDGQILPGEKSNVLRVTEIGTYDVRIKKGNEWSYWSPQPVEVKVKEATQTPAIKTAPLYSQAIPSPDGRNYTKLELPEGYAGYFWRKVGSNIVIGDERTLTVKTPGEYFAHVTEELGCSSLPSPTFKVVNSSGSNAPDPAIGLTASTLSKTEIKLNWGQNPNPAYQETGFEIYRAETEDSPYAFVGSTVENATNFTDSNLLPGKDNYYIVRAVNMNAASAISNQATAFTHSDAQAPTAPLNLRVVKTAENWIKLEWEASIDDVGVASYDVYKNGVKSVVSAKTEATIYSVIKGEVYNFTVKGVDLAGNNSPASNQVTAIAIDSELTYQEYYGSWSMLPDFNTLTPENVGRSSNFDLDVRSKNEYFALKFDGYLHVENAGEYTFFTISDEGSKLYIGGYSEDNLVVNNDGLHGAQERSGTIMLEAGNYPITVTFMEASGGERLEVLWEGPGITKTAIPESVLKEKIETPPAPNAPSDLIAATSSHNAIELNWTDNSTDETGFQVYRANSAEGSFLVVNTIEKDITSYLDQDLEASSTYFYKIKAIGKYGESDFSHEGLAIPVANATTDPLPNSPANPTNLVATAISTSRVSLQWTDNSSEEDQIEIYRSISDNEDYLLIKTLPANTASEGFFEDSNLFSNVTFFYKVLMVNEGGSAESNEASVKTLNNLPVLDEIQDVRMRFDHQKTINLIATDEDNEQLTFAAQNLPSFAVFTDQGDGTATLSLTPSLENIGVYDEVIISVTDENEGILTHTISITVDDNYVPVISEVENVSVLGGETAQLSIFATDENPEDVLSWTFNHLPTFAEVQQISEQEALLSFKPSFTEAGSYVIEVEVTDGRGIPALKEVVVTVVGFDFNTNVYVNFTQGNLFAASPWNNVTSYSAGSTQTALLDKDGEATNITVTLVDGWGGRGAVGMSSGIYPTNVTKSFFYDNSGTNEVQLSGLNPGESYDIALFASREASGTRVTEYTINNQTLSLDVINNTSNTANFIGVQADENGKVSISSKQASGASYMYIGALVITQEQLDGGIPAKPTHLSAQLIPDNLGVQLNWTDRSVNEEAFEIYRSTDIDESFTLLNPDKAIPDLESYRDITIQGNSSYYYKVKAVNVNGSSPFSETVIVEVPNVAPKISPIDTSYIIAVNTTETIQVSATDDTGDNIYLSLINAPEFVTLIDNGNGSGTISLNPTESVVGDYENIILKAEDQHGEERNFSFNVSVYNPDAYSLTLNFTGSSNYTASSPWNNMIGSPYAGLSVNNLKDNTNKPTTISATLLDSWKGTNYEGSTNSNLYPQEVSASCFWEQSTEVKRIQLSGLDDSMHYKFTFFASRNGSGDRSTNFSINGTTVTLNASYNDNNTVQISDIAPINGEIMINIQKASSASYGYINALTVEVYAPKSIEEPVSNETPTGLIASGKTSNIGLSWNDNSTTETAYEIWRSTSLDGTYSLIGSTPAESTSYLDGSAQVNTIYYYRVRAQLSNGFSEYSNVSSASRILFSISVNMNVENPAAAPWNNLDAAPDGGLVLNYLKTNTNIIPGVSLEIVENNPDYRPALFGFNGDNPLGMNTGNNSGIVPDNVMRSTYWMDKGRHAQIKISGLDLTFGYNFKFFASRNGSGDRTTEYIIGNRKTSLNASYNTSNIAEIGGVFADENGDVIITITAASGASYAYLGGLIVEVYNKGEVPNDDAEKESTQTFAAKMNDNGEAGSNLDEEVIEKGEINVYPNPFESSLKLQLKGLSDNPELQLIIYDFSGKKVYSKKNIQVDEFSVVNIELDDPSISSGLYLMEVVINCSDRKMVKIIKK